MLVIENKKIIMKNTILYAFVIAIAVSACGTIQSVVKSTFPYTSTLTIPASTKVNTSSVAVSTASSFDQIFTGQGSNTTQISQVRVASVKLESTNPSNQSLGILKAAKIYLINNNNETLIATRTDIAPTVGRAIMLDIDNTKFLDEYLKAGNVKVRLEYTLESSLSTDLSVKASIGFNVLPASN